MALAYAMPRVVATVLLPATLLLISGCVLAPGRAAERRKLDEQKQYQRPIEDRQLAAVPAPAQWGDVLERAFLTNGDLEASYDQWRAAVARIDQMGAWPNSNVMVSYSYLFSGGNMKGWDRTTLGAGFDPSMNLQLPIKTRRAGKVAVEEARAAAARFRKTKFDLQRRVLEGYYGLALVEERLRIQRDNVELLSQLVQSAQSRVRAGAPQQDLLKTQIEYRLAQNELTALEAEVRGERAMLNAMLARAPEEPLELPLQLPPPRPAAPDDRLIAMGVAENPELAALAAQVAGRNEALELARLQYVPDIIPMFSMMGSASQSLGAAVMLPTNVPAIRGMINEAKAMLDESRSMARQTRLDRASAFVAALYFMRSAEKQAELLEGDVLPLAQQAMTSSLQAYAAGTVSYSDLIDTQRTLLNLRVMAAQMRVEREKRLAELESLAGVDVETLERSQDQHPQTQPAAIQAGSGE